jgi:hypothetical protein
MFRNNKTFLFQQPLENQISRQINQPLNNITQVIIWGSLANDVMNDVIKKAKNLIIKDGQDMYAFTEQVKGDIDLRLTVNCKSIINYQEARKKEHKNIKKAVEFEHDDKFDCNSSMSSSHSTQYDTCEPSFDSEIQTLIYIVGKDELENEAILNKMKDIPNINNNHQIITMCHLFKDGQISCSFNIEKMQVSHYSTYNINTLSKDIFKQIKKCNEAYQKNLEKEETNKMKDDILNNFKSTIDQKADEFFDKKSSSCCFR